MGTLVLGGAATIRMLRELGVIPLFERNVIDGY